MQKNYTDNEINIHPNYGKYGKFVKIKKQNFSIQLKYLIAVRVFVIVVIALLFVAGLSIVINDFVLPMSKAIKNDLGITDNLDEEDLISISKEQILFVVGTDNALSEDYEPKLTAYKDLQINILMQESLVKMTNKAKEDGVSLSFSDGYISEKEQKIIFDNEVNHFMLDEGMTAVMANHYASQNVNLPNESDSQTGLCLTIEKTTTKIEKNPTYLWLQKNANDFGFVFRYPVGKENKTKINSNLYVIRYVGSENSAKMRQLAMCLEEYVEYID